MIKNISKISRVEIKGLWGQFDLNWELNPDVNILSGINGSGKSTVLDCVAGLLVSGTLEGDILKSIKIVFDNGKCISFEHLKETIKSLEQKAKNDNKYKQIISDIKEREGSNYKKIKDISFGITSFEELELTPEELNSLINISIVSTFDTVISELGDTELLKRSDKNVKTELDWRISQLQKQYLDYQLNIGKRAFEIVSTGGDNTKDEVIKIKKKHERFLEIIDNLFSETGKKINRTKNEIEFLLGKRDISAYKLSSGEKQMLVILLTVLVQDNKPSILFMDEPEISLHFDWQKKLIQYILELNDNVQVILATHSPAVIMEGWRNKVFDMKNLLALDSTENKKKLLSI